MAAGPFKVYWKRQLVGVITEVAWSDFPWIAGKWETRRLGKRLRGVLEWFEAQSEGDELKEPPFEPELLESWSLVKPDQTRVELIGPPIVHFADGSVEWRE
jgi:hypothetical protein